MRRLFPFLSLTTLMLTAACQAPAPEVGNLRSAVNILDMLLATHERGKPNHFYESLWMPNPLDHAAFYASVEATVRGQCPSGDQACQHQWIAMTPAAVAQGLDPSKPADLAAWQSRWNTIATFYKTSGKSAEGFKKALEFVSTEVTKQSRYEDDWNVRLKKKLFDPARQIRDRLNAAAGPIRGAAQVELANVRQTVLEVQAVNAAYQARVSQANTAYQAVADAFASYRAGEVQRGLALEAIARTASTADIAGLAILKVQLSATSLQESDQAGEIIRSARRIERQLGAAHTDYEHAIAPYDAFMKARNLPRLDLVGAVARALVGMVAYADAREQRIAQSVTRLVGELRRRTTALIAQAADAATRDTHAQAAHLRASAEFINEATARTERLLKVAPRSAKLKLSFVAGARDEAAAYLGLERLCTASPVQAWMEDGCLLMKPSFLSARSYLATRLPSLVRLQVALMRKAKVDDAVLSEAEAQLSAGNLKGAVETHDVAVYLSEGGTP